MTLTFTPAGHKYRLDDLPVPSVTTLLKGFPKTLEYWSARMVAEYVADNPEAVEQLRAMGRNSMVGALKEIPWDKRDRAAVRGTDVHALAERLVHGEQVDVPEHLNGYVQGYVRFLDRWQPEPILTERPCASRKYWYAGTPDLFATIDGIVWGLDVKTSSGVYGEHASQIAAYAEAEFYMDAELNEQPMPHAERLAVLHVQESCTDVLPVTDPAGAFKDFLHAAWIARAKKRIDAQIGEPMRHPSETKSEEAA